MNRFIRLVSICLISLVSSVAVFSLDSGRCDSLQRVISQSTNTPDVMNALELLSRFYYQKPEEFILLNKLLNEAIRVDSMDRAYSTIAYLTRYHYNNDEKDSLIRLANFTDSLCEAKDKMPDAYYTLHSCISKVDLYRGNYELAVNEALRLYDKAQTKKHRFGIICSSETLGSIYQVSRRDSDAVPFFEQALNGLEEMNGDAYYRVRIFASLIESCLRLDRLDQTIVLLERMEKAMVESDELDKKNHMDREQNFYLWQMKSFYVDLYLRQNQMEKAKVALAIASACVKDATLSDFPNYQLSYYLSARARYFKKTKDYPLALVSIDSILKYSSEPEDLKLKIDILYDRGDFREAAILYRQVMQLVDQKNDEAFLRQVNHLRVLYEVNEKEIQAKELLISNIKVKTKQHQLCFSMSICLILFVVSYIFYLLLKRTRLLKNELLLEKYSLVESKQKLSIEKKKAEEANQMKSVFIANISHEIRTPLNAIVGFSALLAEPAYKEEKDDFVKIINNNSDLLLNLVNDVLDLSRMEAGGLKFVFKPCELITCCKEVLNSVKHRVAEGVKLTLTPVSAPFVLQTDPLRLQQLLLNLLSNAAKFTSEGEITLSFEVDNEKRQVQFMVTDTGCGIPLEKQTKIFERFEKLDEYVQGTGLGLSICCLIADRLGGAVTIDPTYTVGARFVFLHPFDAI